MPNFPLLSCSPRKINSHTIKDILYKSTAIKSRTWTRTSPTIFST
nr:MAG TPA: hypothetical protein [Bacteriophage sp.]